MRHIKSERLKKLEAELVDLEQWLKLGLVPKKDLEKHKDEIHAVQSKIEEEKERLQFLRESGEAEEYIAPKRPSARAGYNDMPTIPDIEMGESGMGETAFDMETEMTDTDSSGAEDKEDGDEETSANEEEEEDESYFSDRNRWKRGGIIDPDNDDW